jgi:hypothetical protein
MEDEFDSLRKKSVRTSSVYEELEEEESGRPAIGAIISGFSPGQRLLLAVLLLLNVLALGFALLAMAGVIRF